MKNIADIYEGILGDIDDNIDSAEVFIKNVNIEFETLKKDLCLTKSFNTNPGWRNGTHLYVKHCKNLLSSIDIDGEMLCIKIFNPGIKEAFSWSVEIFTLKSRGTGKPANVVTSKKMSFKENEYKKLSDIVKNVIKPSISTIANFKKFII